MPLKQTPLFDRHLAHQARMAEFAGFQMPLQYPDGAIAEHRLVRSSAGLGDISHMGLVKVHGWQAGDALAFALSLDVRNMEPFTAAYALICAPDGGIVDDIFVYRLSDHYLLVLNAANTATDISWLQEHTSEFAVGIQKTDAAMLALQGPKALELAAGLLQKPLGIPRFGIAELQYGGRDLMISRTGYTGEDGIEIICPPDAADELWQAILKKAAELKIECGPVGLAARDSLRFEPGFPLYGHELSRDNSPAESRLLWACDFSHDFIGRDAVLARSFQLAQPNGQRVLTRFAMMDDGVPRQGCEVLNDEGQVIGQVCSGMRSPSLELFAGNAYIDQAYARADSEIYINIRGKGKKARVLARPLFRPAYRDESKGTSLGGQAGTTANGGAQTIPQNDPGQPGDFQNRHIGPGASDQQAMLASLQCHDLEQLLIEAIPPNIRLK
ncbi:MAG: glycine cleavage system aminomethyltransferase GcvT, partial [Spirochaetaceae bacterium]